MTQRVTQTNRLRPSNLAKLSLTERFELGKSRRKILPRQALGEFSSQSAGRDSLAILRQQNATRLQELVPIRHARMLTSPFAFFRGSALLMARDLANHPVTGIQVQACGDMHVSNFGVYASAERNLIFAINDFDETFPGPWEWDLKRLCASATVAVRFLGGDDAAGKEAARLVSRIYRQRMHEYAQMGFMDVWYSSISDAQVLNVLSRDTRAKAKTLMAKARGRNHLQVLEKMAALVDGGHRIVEQKPVLYHESHTESGRPIAEALTLFLDAYLASLPKDRAQLVQRYRVVDVARKIVGVGSVGTRCWVVFLQGASDDDPLFLQVKEAGPSVIQPDGRKVFKNEGRRVVVGQRIIQGSPDIFLGWGVQDGVHFYVRQLRDMKGGIEITPGKTRLGNFLEYCSLCGWGLALAHAKSGDPAVLAGYVGKSDALDEAMVSFSLAYADQTEQDYAQFKLAAEHGTIPVSAGR